MPTIFSHALTATAAAQWWPGRLPPRFWLWTAVCAIVPDVDVIAFAFGIPYGDMFGHRGFTHSIFFAVVFGFVAARANSLGVGRWRWGVLWAWFAAVTMSHGILDAFTNGGRGIAFFAPFSGDRYFFPWRPIEVSPIGAGFFSARGLRVLACEAGWIGLPSAIIAVSARLFRNGQT